MLVVIICLLIVSIALAATNIYFIFKNKNFKNRKFIDENKEIFGTHNEGCSLDDHKILQFYSSDDMGLNQ